MRLHALLHLACIVVPMDSESKSRGGGFDPNWEEALASPGLRRCACARVRRALFSKMFLLHLTCFACHLVGRWCGMMRACALGAKAWFVTKYDSNGGGLMRLAALAGHSI